MAYTAERETNTNVLHCKIYFGGGHRTNHQLKMPKHLDVIFPRFEIPF